jgi:hypothetical protein
MLKERRYTIVAEEDYGEDDEAERRADELFNKLSLELERMMSERVHH